MTDINDSRRCLPRTSLRWTLGLTLRETGRLAVALVWLHQGLWHKILVMSPSHRAVLGSVPFLSGRLSGLATAGIGIVETILAIWVLSNRKARLAGLAQTFLLIVMNAGGLVWGADSIPDPVGMVTQNLVFLTLVWTVTTEESADGSKENTHAVG